MSGICEQTEQIQDDKSSAMKKSDTKKRKGTKKEMGKK